MRVLPLLLLGVILCPDPGRSSEAEAVCAHPAITVAAQDASLVAEVCAVVDRTLPRLAACGLDPHHPVRIAVSDSAAIPGLMAHYGIRSDQIVVRSPGRLTTVLGADSLYRLLPVRDLFDSILAHELTHAFFVETPCGQSTCIAAHEYIASAMQLDALPPASRDLLLNAHAPGRPPVLEDFTDAALKGDPETFAIDAWRHFRQPGNGCAFLRALVDGTAEFPSPTE